MVEFHVEIRRQDPEEDEVAKKLGMSVGEYRATMEKLGRSGMDKLEMLDIDEMAQTFSGAEGRAPGGPLQRRSWQAWSPGRSSSYPSVGISSSRALYYREERTLRESAPSLDISESRVCQIHTSHPPPAEPRRAKE